MQLEEWIENNVVAEEMHWKRASEYQMQRWMDISAIFGLESPHVIGAHRSKSIVLPVVQYKIGDCRVICRDNFHDIKASVSSTEPMKFHFDSIFTQDEDELRSCYFEGFVSHDIFGAYKAGCKEFSASLTYSDLVILFHLLDIRRRR